LIKYDVLERGFSKQLETKATCNWSTWKKRWKDEDRKLNVAADVDASWEKVRRTRPSYNINMINILCKQKLGGWQINTFERHVKLQANSWHS